MEENNNELPKYIKWTILIFKMISILLAIWFAYDTFTQFFIKN